MATRVIYSVHREEVFTPGLRPPSRDRRAAIEAIQNGEGQYVTVIAGTGLPVTRKANGHDLEGMLSDMADQAIKKSTRTVLRLPVPPVPERSPRAASDDIFRQVTGHFPKHGA